MIGAIVRAQFLSMRWRTGTRRAGVIFSVFTGLSFYGFWAFLGWLVMLLFSGIESAATALPLLSTAMALMTLYWQMAPVVSASFGASLDLRKLLAYPIPHNKLFLIEVLLRITSCAEMLLLIAGADIGLLRNPLFGLRGLPFVVVGSLLFVAMNILLSTGTRDWLERVILRTRLRELFTFLLILIAIAPQFLLRSGIRRSALTRFAPSQIWWPWSSMAHLMLRDSIVISALLSLAWVGAALLFSRIQFEKALRFDGASVKRAPVQQTSRDRLADRIVRFPARLLPDPVAALIEKELRTLTRIPRVRLVYTMSCFFGLVAFAPVLRGAHPDSWAARNALPLMALYGLLLLGQVSYWNAFGFDRSAVQGYFCWPIRFRDALIAKNITVVLLLMPQIIAVALLARVARMNITPGKVIETLAVMTIASLYWFALGNICSVRVPRVMNPDKTTQMSNKLQALAAVGAPFLLLPLGLAYWARSVFESDFVFAGLLFVAGIAGGIFYWVGLESAVQAAVRRREEIILELSRSDAPLSIT